MLNELLIELQQGNKGVFEDIYDETSKLVFSVCYAYMKNYAVAQDLMQETYLKVYEYINSYKENTNASAWITTIAKNTCLNELKRRKRFDYVEISDDDLIFADKEEKFEETPLIKMAKETLAAKELEIVLMHIVDQMPLVDIAKTLGMIPSSVRWKYNNALNKLRKKMEGGKQ